MASDAYLIETIILTLFSATIGLSAMVITAVLAALALMLMPIERPDNDD